MKHICQFCGKRFTAKDNYQRKYCPKCQKSYNRYYVQFRERRKTDTLADIYTTHYSKRHAIYKANRITKAILDDWRLNAGIKRQEATNKHITVEEFENWCDETLTELKAAYPTC